MAFVDIAYLKKEDVSGGILSYVRHKTGQRLTVRIEPLIEEIIERYEPFVHNSPYLFPIITSNDPEEAFRQYQTALGYHNRKLKKLGKLTGENLHLSSYTARHSWATIARKHNVPLSRHKCRYGTHFREDYTHILGFCRKFTDRQGQ